MGNVFIATDRDGMTALVSEGRMLTFNFGGKLMSDQAVDIAGLRDVKEVDALSILQCGADLELAFHINGVFSKAAPRAGVADIAQTVNNLPGIVFNGRRDGAIDGVGFSQYIYTFLKGTLNPGITQVFV